MSSLIKRLIAVGSIVAILAIFAPIFYYLKDFWGLSRSTVPADWGAFGDFIGGILNPVISLLTLIVTIAIAVHIGKIERRNHDETVHSVVKPLLTIFSGDFYSADISSIGPSVERDYYTYEAPKVPAGRNDFMNKDFSIIINNNGLGIATNVNISFDIELTELKALLAVDHPKLKTISTDITVDEESRRYIALKIESKPYNYHGFFYKVWERESYGLGVIKKDEKTEALVPTQMMGAFQLYNLVRKLKNIDTVFPTLFVTLSFKDIHGKELSSKFRVAFLNRFDYTHYSLYRIVQENI